MLAGRTIQGLGAVIAITVGWFSAPDTAEARTRSNHYGASGYARHYAGAIRGGMHFGSRHYTSLRSWARSGLQCVPFARENSGIELSGNAGTWWDNADGLYQRGAKPEVGSILNFRATGRMRMGHVAVVTNVIDSRHLEIDHANWASAGRVSRDIDVVDVSPSNDWTAVRVELGHTDEFGSVYPTYGFIYDRPDQGTMVANVGITKSASPILNPAPSDLRPASDRISTPTLATAPEEVAEAMDDGDNEPVLSSHRSYRHGSRHGRNVETKSYGRYGSIVGSTHMHGYTRVHSMEPSQRAYFTRSAQPLHASIYRVSTHTTAMPTASHHRRHS